MSGLLVTGGLGFIGSHCIDLLLKKEANRKIINLDKITYCSNEYLNETFDKSENYIFVKGDICDEELLQSLFEKYDIRDVIHLAAESHVDNSISGPRVFFQTNILGTGNLLEVARKYWMEGPFKFKAGYENTRFHHVSTDEVFGSLEDGEFFTEETAYAPNNPYSASKASSDFLVRSYQKTFGFQAVTTNCSNNFGPRQHDEKLIPTVIRNALKGNDIPIYGTGENIRDWLYVSAHAEAIYLAFKEGRVGETYNIGTRNELTNIVLCKEICRKLDELHPKENGSYEDQIKFVTDRPGHDHRYAIDPSKIERELAFKNEFTFNDELHKTIEWYLKWYLEEYRD